jgi:hypothetical protein
MQSHELTQQAFAALAQLGALVATPGVDEETLKQANVNIRLLLDVLNPEFKKLTAKSNGLIIN